MHSMAFGELGVGGRWYKRCVDGDQVTFLDVLRSVTYCWELGNALPLVEVRRPGLARDAPGRRALRGARRSRHGQQDHGRGGSRSAPAPVSACCSAPMSTTRAACRRTRSTSTPYSRAARTSCASGRPTTTVEPDRERRGDGHRRHAAAG
jgi:hypothetical protein